MARRTTIALASALALAAVAGCGDNAEPKPSACVPSGEPALVAAAREHVRNVSVDGAATPKGEQRVEADRIAISACRSSDDAARATVTVVGVHGGPIADVRHELVLARRSSGWTIVRDGDSYRCRDGHGQSDFEPRRCT